MRRRRKIDSTGTGVEAGAGQETGIRAKRRRKIRNTVLQKKK